ncbi:hypothetical protein BKA62DRAFT_768120 [Auriculariales sp. MPI-PUGE-AT-0066]|nr:hypothetical protein BKA62DRAFT_768120 [Auriculariales sp. MPI-PUGE-AT-0066]
MKFASSLFVVAAAATAALAAPAEPSDGGHGVPPAATVSPAASGTSSAATTSTAAPVTKAAANNQLPDIEIPFSTTNALFRMTPADAGTWEVKEHPGVFNVTAHFAVKNLDKATATFLPPQSFAGIKVYAYQRPDAGVMFMTIDGVAPIRIDYFNKTATDKDAPVLVYENPHLKRAHHIVEFKNVEDPRSKKFGNFNLDHIVITAAADPERTDIQTSTDAPSTPAPSSTPKPDVPLTAPTEPEGAGGAQQQTGTVPGGTAFAVSAPKALFSVAALLAAAFTLL